MNALRQGTIVSREDGPGYCYYEIRTRNGVILPRFEDDVRGQPRLEPGSKVWFAMEAGKVGYLSTTKPGRELLASGHITKAHLYGEERIIVYVRTETAYHLARPWLASIFGEIGQRMTREQRQRLVKTLEGQPYQIRLWPRSTWCCDLIQPRPRRKRRKVPPRLKAVTSSENVSEVTA